MRAHLFTRWAAGPLCAALATAAAAADAPSANAPSAKARSAEADEKPAPPRLLITGAPSEVTASGDAPCVTFQVLPQPNAGPFTLRTAGLADAALYPGRGCAPGPGWRSLVVPAAPAARALDVSLRPDLSGLEGDAAKLEGRVFAMDAAGEAGAVALTVRSPPISNVEKVALWVAGILAPALVGLAAGWFVFLRDREDKERETFLHFATTRRDEVAKVVKDDVWLSLYATQVDNADRAGDAWRALRGAELIGNVPLQARKALRAAYLRNDAEGLRANLFSLLQQHMPDVAAHIAFPVGTPPDEAKP